MKAKDRTKAILTRKGTGNNSGEHREPKKRGKNCGRRFGFGALTKAILCSGNSSII